MVLFQNALIYIFNTKTLRTPPDGDLSEKTKSVVKASSHASLQDVLSGKTMEAVKYLLGGDGSAFVYGRKFCTRPVEDHFVREAAQYSSVIITRCSSTSKESHICAVSFMNSFLTKRGLRVNLFLYTKTIDITLIIAHVHMTVGNIVAIAGKNDIGLYVHFPKEFDRGKVDEILENQFGSSLKEDGPVPNGQILCGTKLIKSRL